jgi:hypothetical protein
MLYPISFSIPKEKIISDIIPKEKIMSTYIPGIPGDSRTYIYDNETEYYNEYKKSYFAITKKKAGWDCMRHYEILANGCIPFFIDIENCPVNTMALCPKDLFIEANTLCSKFITKNIYELTMTDLNEYYILRSKLLEYTKNHLTTDKMASYILEKTNFTNVTRILYLTQDPSPDYLRCLTLHGFKELFGEKCHDFPKIPHIYKSHNLDINNLYGRGMTYSNLLEPNLHNNSLDNTIEEDIKNKYYDIIIYGSYHRGMPYYDLICQVYKPNEIILLCGEDIHCCNYNYFLEKGHNLFVREL